MFPQTLTSRSAKTSPPSSAFVVIPPPTTHRGGCGTAAVFARQPHLLFAPSSSLPSCADDDETTTTAAEVRTIVAAAAAEACSFWEPRCCIHHHRDSPLVVLVPEGTDAEADRDDDDDDDDDDSARTKALLGAVVAGFGFALWALLVLQPLSATHILVVMESTSTHLCFMIVIAMTVSALLTVLLMFCETFIGPCSVTGCGFGTRHTNKHRRAPFPSLREQLRRCLQIALGNTAGAVFGATLAAVAIHSAADVGFTAAADTMCAALDAARTVSDDHPAPCVFLSAVVAGFLLTAAMSGSDLLVEHTHMFRTLRPARVRTLLLFCACFVIVLFDLRLGLVDKSLVSAAAAFNALRPLMILLGPNVFNYVFALLGNILGAALACAAAEIVNCVLSPSRSVPKQFVV